MANNKDFNDMLYHLSTDKGMILAHRALNIRNNLVEHKYRTMRIYLCTRNGLIWSNNINLVIHQRNIDTLAGMIKGIYNNVDYVL